MTTRREALQLGALGAAGVAGVQGGSDNGSGGAASPLAPENRPVPYRGVFRRPPELLPYATTFADGDPARPVDHYAVTARLGRMEVLPGLSTAVAGYNGIFPGPTIRARRGTRIELRMRNGFPEAPGLLLPQRTDTSTHLHGSPSLPQYDGYANDLTVPGHVKTYKYPNTEKASTLWYHDHRHLVTAQNVYSGLAAFYPYSDQYERAQLPQGEYDVPLMISDAQFNADGSLRYDLAEDAGLWGDIILVNGVPWPTMKVKPRIYRFRVLVASISRSYRPTLSNGDPLHVVGTDGGMVPVVQPVRSWRQGTGERVEVLVDFRGFRAGQTVDLRNLSNKNNVDFADTDKIMRFQVVADSGPASTVTAIPTTLDGGPQPNAAQGGISTMALTPAMAVAKRQLRFARQHGVWMVNGVTWEDVEASGFTLLFASPRPFSVEQWTMVNESGGWFHPAHIHLVNGKIVGRNTNGGKPFAWELGPKDVFYLGENESVTALMQFGIQPGGQGKYMIHCHNLVHEDSDMMVQFSAGNPGDNDPVTSDPPVPDTMPLDSYPPAYRPGYPPGT
jgi:spore coat protein A, manganese oxidase